VGFGYVGVEVLPWDRVGFLVEYHLGWVSHREHFPITTEDSHRHHLHRTPEFGAGVVWRLR
jgi:hypothetical protein